MKVNSWSTIILILLLVALVSGLVLGVLGELVNMSPTLRITGIGSVVGITAAFLVSRKIATK